MNSNSSYAESLHIFGPSNTRHFDFTALFEDAFFSIVPSGLLLLVLPFRLWVLRKEKVKIKVKGGAGWGGGGGVLYSVKLALIALFAILQAIILLLHATNPPIRTPTTLASAALVLTNSLALLPLSHGEHLRSLRPSATINTYLLLTLLLDAVRVRTLHLQPAPKPLAALFTTALVVKACMVVAEAVEKRQWLVQRYKHVSKESTSGVYSRAVFWWLNGVLMLGFRGLMKAEDLGSLDEALSSAVVVQKAGTSWAAVDKRGKHALLRAVLHANRARFAAGIFPRLCIVGFRFAQPFLLARTIAFVGSDAADDIGWGLTGAFLVVFLGMAVASAAYYHMCFRAVTGLRGGLVGLVYVKTVDLSVTALDRSAAVTLMSNDTEGVCNAFQNLHELWAVPIELGIALWLLQRQLGLSFIAPAAVAIMSALFTIWISHYMGNAQKIWNKGIQTRVDASTSMLGSMKAVKILGFTPVITRIVHGLRVEELRLSFVFRRLLTASAFFSNNMRLLAPLVTFALFVPFENARGRELPASTTFTTLSLIAMLNPPVSTLLRTIPSLKAGLACLERIQLYLNSESRQIHVLAFDGTSSSSEQRVSKNDGLVIEDGQGRQDIVLEDLQSQRRGTPEMLIDVRSASFGWSRIATPQINDVTFSVHRGDFVFIIGPVGCGKSTLLKGLMSETPSLKGFVYGNTLESAFCDQTPWIQNTTIRENTIGMSAFDKSWYEEVIGACALDFDIAALPESHETMVGSRGISLSGGQKQRVSLARALYSKKQLVIIDDCFSGLDVETEEKVFTNFFGQRGLLRKSNTTVILVTNAVTRLSYADYIFSLDAHGRISEQGTFSQLQHGGGYVQSLATKHRYDIGASSVPTTDEGIDKMAYIPPSTLSQDFIKARATIKAQEKNLSRPVGELSTYKYYFSSIGWSRTLQWLFYTVLSGVAAKMTELLITHWTESPSIRGKEINTLYLGLYGMLAGIGTIFWTVACYYFFLYLVPVSAEELHARLLSTVMNAPLSFFTSTDTGVTTNRFSQDMSIVDQDLPFALIDLIVAVVQAIMGAILMCFVAGYFALTLPPVILIVWLLQKYYLRTSRQVRLLDLEAKSPLYSHFIESLSGLVTIRAFQWSNAFVEQHLALLDNSQKPYYLLWCIQRWLALVLDLMVTVLAVVLMVLIVKLRNSVGSGYTGLALLNIISFSQSLAWVIRQWTALETSIGAISRLKDFTSTTANENLPGENHIVPDSWPTSGAVEFKNLSASYTIDGPLILKDVNISIKPGEKIGICGRTGSGKSSLIMTLLRLLEIPSESSILVDGIDVVKVNRQTVRSRINAIPQDPFFMVGTIRLNASPNNTHSDVEIITALSKVDLWSTVESKGGLDAHLEPEFFSHGQRQLFCLARAILHQSRIIVLDEVSNSIDVATDRLVQRVIREEFRDATIISVAHRLDTILDFDRIALLSEGRLVEFDRPEILLQKPSAFRNLYNS